MMIDLISYIINWQNENDSEFKPLPVDEHSALIFNDENRIFKFIFSSKFKMSECKASIPHELIKDFQFFINQEEGFTYYKFKMDSD